MSVEQKRALVDPQHPKIAVSRQCELLGLSRSSFYYQPAEGSPYNLKLMRLIDEQYTRTPFYGILRMTAYLKGKGHLVNHKRVARLMRMMGLETIYPKPKLSNKEAQTQRYPYLLKGIVIERPNQVWSTDITYIRLHKGFIYLMAIMDWFSRYVVAWEISNSLDHFFCISALERALQIGHPEIFNSDQGSQFTCPAFTARLEQADVRISWDGCGRALDNIFVERLWRSVKYEEVYLKDYTNMPEAIQGLKAYFNFYNTERPHQALQYKTPDQLFFG